MGDNPRLRNKYSRPKRLWDKDRVAEESKIKRKYGLKNMRELWRIKSSLLDKYRRQARLLLSMDPETKEKKGKPIIHKLARLGVLKPDATLEDILSLEVQDFLERRLQTIVFRKGIAKTVKQARQMIVHGHVLIDNRIVNRPGVILDVETEGKVSYVEPVKKSKPKPKQESSEAEGEKSTNDKNTNNPKEEDVPKSENN